LTQKLALILIPLLILSGCASLPTEYKSPCACDYKRINVPGDPQEEEKSVA